ncbi:MAG TPA: tRNA pseudouridine(38-40) synthase TruA [Candidatus Deferrimicrobium sp.]|nr:tRNA pseudouridine(38-40) synthase TruA [Candidatus Deferrimicrobium sp.]
MRYALKVCYFDESREYEGFQRQPDKKTIEGELIHSLQDLGLIEDLSLAAYGAAGRTDKGVHALGQVIALSTQKKLIVSAINSALPRNIRIWASKVVNEQFHPRYDALSRYYRYYTVYSREDIETMRVGAELLEGTHDFQLFSKKVPERSTIRQIHQLRVEKNEKFLIFHIIADSFLWQMVRRIVDSLIKVGQGQWTVEDLKDLLNASPKTNVYTTPHPVENYGVLILWDVEYPFKFEVDNKGLNQVKSLLQNYLGDYSLKHYYLQQTYEFFDIIP